MKNKSRKYVSRNNQDTKSKGNAGSAKAVNDAASGAAAEAETRQAEPSASMSACGNAPASTTPDAPASTTPEAPASTTPDAPASTTPETPASTTPQTKARAGKQARSDAKEVLYRVETKRDDSILKAYITFTYRVYHPRVTGRMIFYGLLIFVPGFFLKLQAAKIACWIIGALMILLALTRQYISLALTKKNDPDYKSGAVFTYDFTSDDAAFYRNGERTSRLARYRDIMVFYYDDQFYYMGLKNRDFIILPRDRFTRGIPDTFENFIYKRSKKACVWIPNDLKGKLAKRRAARAMRMQG